MDFFRDSLLSALLLIRTLDAELIEIVLTSLRVSIAATLIASAIGASLGFSIAIVRFPGKWVFVTLLNTLLALPTVVIGLMVVYTLISRRGILGGLGWLYTQKAMVVGQDGPGIRQGGIRAGRGPGPDSHGHQPVHQRPAQFSPGKDAGLMLYSLRNIRKI